MLLPWAKINCDIICLQIEFITSWQNKLFANLSLCLRIRAVTKGFLAGFLAGNPKSHWMRLRMVITEGLTETFWKYFGYLTFSSGAVTKGSRASCIIRNLSVRLVILRGLPVTFLIRGTSPATGPCREVVRTL